MSNTVAVCGHLVGYPVVQGAAGSPTPLPEGDYQLEKLTGPGDQFHLKPLNAKGLYVVETATLKQARALGRVRFVPERERASSPGNHLTDSVDRLLSGASLDEVLLNEEKTSDYVMKELGKAIEILDRLERNLNRMHTMGRGPANPEKKAYNDALGRVREVIRNGISSIGTMAFKKGDIFALDHPM